MKEYKITHCAGPLCLVEFSHTLYDVTSPEICYAFNCKPSISEESELEFVISV